MTALTHAELDEIAREHVEYEVRKLTEFVAALERLPPYSQWERSGHGAAGQALIDGSLLRLRNLDEFLRARGGEARAYAGRYSDAWTKRGFLGEDYGRVSGKVAHLSRQRLRSEHADFVPSEIAPLAVECCEVLDEFVDGLPQEWCDTFAMTRVQVQAFLRSRQR